MLDLQANLGSLAGWPIAPVKQFTTDVLLTYLLHPGMAVYLGYDNSYINLAPHSGAPPFATALGAPNNSTSPLCFIKLSYLLRF